MSEAGNQLNLVQLLQCSADSSSISTYVPNKKVICRPTW